jgi:hypothetical protein
MRGSLVEQYNPTLESCKEMDPLILLTQVLWTHSRSDSQ